MVLQLKAVLKVVQPVSRQLSDLHRMLKDALKVPAQQRLLQELSSKVLSQQLLLAAILKQIGTQVG